MSMMQSRKAPARLTSDLLAPKGQATPSIVSLDWFNNEPRRHADSGARSMHAVDAGAGDPAARPKRTQERATGTDGNAPPRIAMTLRMDHERHLRLKLLAAHRGQSAQEILTEAFDAFLGRPEFASLLIRCRCLK